MHARSRVGPEGSREGSGLAESTARSASGSLKTQVLSPLARPGTPGRTTQDTQNRTEQTRRPRARRVSVPAEVTPTDVNPAEAGQSVVTMTEAASEASDTIQTILTRLQDEFGTDRVHRYFHVQAKLEMRGSQLLVTVPTSLQIGLIERIFGKALREILGDVLRDASPTIAFVTDPDFFPSQLTDPDLMPRGDAETQPKAKAPKALARGKSKSEAFDDRCDLARFVVGEANEMAFDGATKMADLSSPPAFTRLFLHSECGLGKTHLLRGIVRRVLGVNPQARVRYVAAEAFTNEYIASVQAGTVEAFRKRYRSLDLLCLDDIHFLSHKTATQTEILHTFDAIEIGGARLVLASDVHPGEIEELNKGLLNRLLSGLVVKIQTPEVALRRRMVLELAQRRGLRLDEQGVQRLVEDPSRGTWTVRELEGALTRISATAGVITDRTPEGAIPMHVVERAMSALGRTGMPVRAVRFDHVRDAVCTTLEVEHKDLGASGRHKKVVLARAIITLLCKQMTTLSYPEIARKLGKTNHSTVITAHQRIAGQLGEVVSLGLAVDGVTVAQLAESIGRRIKESGTQA